MDKCLDCWCCIILEAGEAWIDVGLGGFLVRVNGLFRHAGGPVFLVCFPYMIISKLSGVAGSVILLDRQT